MPDDPGLRIFPDEYVPNAEGAEYHRRWVKANPAEAQKWATFRDAAIASPGGAVVPVMASKYGRALVAAGKEHMSISYFVGTVTNPYPPPPVVVPPAPPPTGTLIFNGDFDVSGSDENEQWSVTNEAVSSRFSCVASDGAVTPRGGMKMARVELRFNEDVFGNGTNVALTEKQGLPNIGLDSDVYYGFSIRLPSGYAPAPGTYANNFIEWHGTGPMSQAPIHFFVDPLNYNPPHWLVDLHTDVTGYNPKGRWSMGALVYDTWVDFVIRTLWKNTATGRVEGWRNGVKQFDSGPILTWGTGVGIVKPQAGHYRANYNATTVIYLDECRIGTTREIVDPANYS